MRERWLFSSWLLPALWMGVLYYVLTMEVDPEPPVWAFPHIDKLIHFGLFGILAWLWFIPTRWTLAKPTLQAAVIGFLVASVYGGFTEYVQSTMPHRHGNVWDVLANSLGAATVFIPFLQRRCNAILLASKALITGNKPCSLDSQR